MATKKKTFDAVASSRRWRIASSRQLRGLSFPEQQALLQRTTEEFFAGLPKRRTRVLTHR